MPKTYEPIATTTLGSNQTTITFSSIPSTYTDLVIVSNMGTTTASYPFIRFNGDTGLTVTVNVNAGSVIAEEGLKDVIRDSLLNDSLQAKFASIYRQGGLGAFG